MMPITAEEATTLGVPVRNWLCSDIRSEAQLREKLALWRTRLREAEDPRYQQTCQRMISQYATRIDRLGVRLTCAD